MNRIASFSILRWISLLLIFIAIVLTLLQLATYSRVRANFPAGLEVAQIPIGGLDRQQAAERVLQAYAGPVEVHYSGAVIQIKPALVGYEIQLDSMLSAADLQRVNQPFWEGFWDYLWSRKQSVSPVPLRDNITNPQVQQRIKAYLKDEIAARYDQPAQPAQPVPGSVEFQPGQPGTTLDVERAATLIGDALRSPAARSVNLTYSSSSVPRPSIQNLQILIEQIIDLADFKGISEIYLKDMKTGQGLHFTYQTGQKSALPLDIAFSSWSTIKIPVMVSAFRKLNENPPEETLAQMQRMIERSDNTSTDRLAMTAIDENTAPLAVTQDLQTLGLNNTFWGGFFYPGAPLLKKYSTSANQRTDINTDPDIYAQATAGDLGTLLEDIYICAQDGGGAILAAFPDQVTQSECKQMINYLLMDKIAVLVQAGLPAEAQFAHKHGWATETKDGLIHTMADAGIAFTNANDYVLVIFVHDPNQIMWEAVNQMIAAISRAIYNFFNIQIQ